MKKIYLTRGKKNPNMARKGKSNPFYGRLHSEDSRKKMSDAHKGMKHSEETKKKQSEAFKGNKSYMFGKEKSFEIRQKLREANLGKHPTNETRKKMSEAQKGEKGSNWRGGLSFIMYPQDWTDDLKECIRKRDNYICKICGLHQEELTNHYSKLDIHHIDYDKLNCNPTNLITLCRSCHIKTNYDRENWLIIFKNNE